MTETYSGRNIPVPKVFQVRSVEPQSRYKSKIGATNFLMIACLGLVEIRKVKNYMSAEVERFIRAKFNVDTTSITARLFSPFVFISCQGDKLHNKNSIND